MSMNVSGIDNGKIAALFALIDKNGDGKINAGEIKEAGYEPSIFNIPEGKEWTSTQFTSAINSNADIKAKLFGDSAKKQDQLDNKQNDSIFDNPNVKKLQKNENKAQNEFK